MRIRRAVFRVACSRWFGFALQKLQYPLPVDLDKRNAKVWEILKLLGDR